MTADAMRDRVVAQIQGLIRRVATHARCESCGWHGAINDMIFRGMYPDRCPKCGTRSCTLTDEVPT